MRREGFLCFGCRTSQNILDLLDFDQKKIKIKEIEMDYINFFENNLNYFFKYDGLRRTALIEYSHHKESRVVL